MKICIVYWLFDSACTDPLLHGYIGISKHLPRRVIEHRRRFGGCFEVKVLFSGTRAECYAEERRLRPEHSIGWNMIAGGLADRIYPPSVREKIGNRNKGKKRSEEFKENLRRKLTGKKHPPDRCARNSNRQLGHPVSAKVLANWEIVRRLGQSPEATQRRIEAIRRRTFTDEQRARMASGAKGKKRSDAHKAAIAAANKRRVISEDTRLKMSASKKGRTLSVETRQKMAAAQRKRWERLSSETDRKGQVVHG